MGDEYCLILALFLSNRHYFCVSFSTASLPSDTFSLLALPCNRHLNLPTWGRFTPKKKPQGSRLEFLRAQGLSLKDSAQLGCLFIITQYINLYFKMRLSATMEDALLNKSPSNPVFTWVERIFLLIQ